MHFLLTDTNDDRLNLRPFSHTRPLGLLRNGILTQCDRWKKYLKVEVVHTLTADYLKDAFAGPKMLGRGDVLIRSTWVASAEAAKAVYALEPGQVLGLGGQALAVCLDEPMASSEAEHYLTTALPRVLLMIEPQLILFPWDLFLQAKHIIEADFDLVTAGRKSCAVGDAHTIVYNPERIFIEEGVKIRAAVLNAENGCIYLGKNSQVQEGALLVGTMALLESATANMGAKLRGDNLIGPYCKVGGEVANSILMGYSNKGHDGYLGNSVLGEWCNLGADTNTSNLKNNYSIVHVRLAPSEAAINTGQLFCGLLMGDHSKCGINTMFNTGTAVGVGSSLFGGGFMPKSIGNFSWGGEGGEITPHQIDKMLETERRVMARRTKTLSAEYEAVLRHLYAGGARGVIDL